jgi:hypothetical protein
MAPNLSLWLAAPAEVEAHLDAEIRRIAASTGGPAFAPHVTILGSCGDVTASEAESLLGELRGSGPVPLMFARCAGEPVWNQGAVAVVEESEALNALLRLARSVFHGISPEEPIVWSPPLGKPHLSLVYGCNPSLADSLAVPAGFTASEIALVLTEPATLEGVPLWKELCRVKL